MVPADRKDLFEPQRRGGSEKSFIWFFWFYSFNRKYFPLRLSASAVSYKKSLKEQLGKFLARALSSHERLAHQKCINPIISHQLHIIACVDT